MDPETKTSPQFNKALEAISALVESVNPLTKWQSELQQLKPQVQDAIKSGVSRRKIILALQESGYEIPAAQFANIFGLRSKKRTKATESEAQSPIDEKASTRNQDQSMSDQHKSKSAEP